MGRKAEELWTSLRGYLKHRNSNPIWTYRFIYKEENLLKNMEEKYIMFSMEDERIKGLSEALSNPSCKKIINLLSEKELTETDIAKELKVPLNTIDYNIKKLISVGLIEKTNHFWSIRGKKMPVYRVSNKKIVISPKKSLSFTALIASAIGTGLIAFGIERFSAQRINEEVFFAEDSLAAVPMIAQKGSEVARDFASTGFAGWQWFLLGAWLGIALFFIFSSLNGRRHLK